MTRTRAYSALLGRWINRDPIGESGGVNQYAYVENSPTDSNDPSGEIKPSQMSCAELAQTIAQIAEELAKRQQEMEENKLDLPPDDGHCTKFKETQVYLNRLKDAFNDKGCQGPLKGNPEHWASTPVPKPNQDPNRFNRANQQPTVLPPPSLSPEDIQALWNLIGEFIRWSVAK